MTHAPQNPLNTQVLYLVSWPSLQHLLGNSAPQITRICALLARRPTVGMLIPVILNLPHHIAHPLLETLYADGCIRMAGTTAAPSASAPPPKAESVPSEVPVADLYFLTRLWQHLINKA